MSKQAIETAILIAILAVSLVVALFIVSGWFAWVDDGETEPRPNHPMRRDGGP